jgi:hypothetical protein
MPARSPCVLAAIGFSLFLGSSAHAQTPAEQSPAPDPAGQSQPPDPTAPTPSIESDQIVVNVPTTLPLRRHHSYFRITHRFARDLTRGTFGQLAEDLFSLDSGAIIGLEYRFGLTSNIQAGVHRSILGKTIVIFGKWDAWQQNAGRPFGLSFVPSVEAQDNLTLDHQPGISATISRAFGSRLVAYASPAYIHNAHTGTLRAGHGDHEHEGEVSEEDADVDETDTAFIGLGARARIRPSVAIVLEVNPRLGGYTPGAAAWNVGIEKLTRGHVLQLNFGNNFDSTPGMIARGGNEDQVYLGFNLSRRW